MNGKRAFLIVMCFLTPWFAHGARGEDLRHCEERASTNRGNRHAPEGQQLAERFFGINTGEADTLFKETGLLFRAPYSCQPPTQYRV